MQSLIMNNILLNELAGRLLSSQKSIVKKITVNLLVLISLFFYGCESIITNLFKK
mgnify:CR=1